ncbi:MAG: hypothetical protein AAF696_09350 [Bacteroidota bacterium]
MNEEIVEKIEQYLAGTLPQNEILAFETEVQADPQLAAAIREQYAGMLAVQQAGDRELKAQLNQRGQQQFDGGKVIKPNFWNRPTVWLAIAAALAVLITFAIVLNNQEAPALPELYAQYESELDNALSQSRDISEKKDSLWEEVVLSFQEEEVEERLKDLNTYIERGSSKSKKGEAYLLKGVILLKERNSEEAVAAFEQVPEEHQYSRDAAWYTALAYMQADNLSAAKAALTSIAESKVHKKRKEAREILESLE